MKKVIYLHIGQTKTATTTLQAFFSANRTWLSERGILYPECPVDHPIKSQHRFLVEALGRTEQPLPDRIAQWEFLIEQIQKSSHPLTLISEEVFWHLFEQRSDEKKAAIEWIHRKLGAYDVKIICYVRRQDTWIESWYNQLTKTDVNRHSKMNYLEFISAYRNYGLLDYTASLQPWTDVFGNENMAVRPFQRSDFLEGDIISDFMNLLGVRDLNGTTRPKDQQVSLHNTSCEISALHNKTARATDFKRKFMEIVKSYDGEVNDQRKFTPRTVAEGLISEFKASNQRLAELYFSQRSDFFDESLRGYENGEYPGISPTELTEFVIHLFQDQQSQIRGMRKRISELENQLKN